MSNNTERAGALVVESSGRWLGNDGEWSTFYVHIGTPPQIFHVLPSFKGQSVFVPIDKDCERFNISDCGRLRGVEIWGSRPSSGFQPAHSKSWAEMGTYRVGLGTSFGLQGNGAFGNDTAGLGTGGAAKVVSMEQQAVVAYATSDLWVGQLGLSQYALNMSNTVTPHSFLSRLKEEGHIPSLSFGYQAGAFYRFTRIPGSLTLGGYDRSRISGPSLRLSSVSDINVGLQSITITSPNGTTTTLLSSGIITTVDTAISELWLPPSICDAFASALGLTYVAVADRYILTDTAHSALRAAHPTFKFSIGASVRGGEAITIEIPYAAFDLQAKFPIFATPTNYFPLRRAANESQYALGRAFMQELYLSVDLERDEFNVSQALFEARMPESDIVTIPSVNMTEDRWQLHDVRQGSNKLSTAIMAGIGVCVVLVALVLFSVCWWIWRRKPKRRKVGVNVIGPSPTLEGVKELEDGDSKVELDGGITPEMYAPHGKSEIYYNGAVRQINTELAEVEGTSSMFELP